MRRSSDFTTVVRAGSRTRNGAVVVHQHRSVSASSHSAGPALVGLIVGKGVGGSVVRHRVSRRLRAELSGRLSRLPDGSGLVVRALPESATASSAQLGADLDRALARLGAG